MVAMSYMFVREAWNSVLNWKCMCVLNCAVDYACTGLRRSIILAVAIESCLKVTNKGILIFFNKQLQKLNALF